MASTANAQANARRLTFAVMTGPAVHYFAPKDERTITIAFSFGAIARVHKAIVGKTNRLFPRAGPP